MSDFGCHEPFDVGPCVTQTVRVCLRGPLDPVAIPALAVRTCSGGVLQATPAFFAPDGVTALPTYTIADVVDCPEEVFDWGGGNGSGSVSDGSITTAKLADGSVTTAKLGFGVVTPANIAGSAIIGVKIATGAVSLTKIGDGAVSNAKLSDAPAFSLKGNDTAAPAAPVDLTVAQIKALLNYTATDVGAGDMVLASAQTNTGAKTFNDATLLMNNVAGTFASRFTNTNAAARTYTLRDRDGVVMFADGDTMTGALNYAATQTIASAATTDIGAATSNSIVISGTTTITSLGTIAAGAERVVRFSGALTLTHNATSLILPGSANITTAAGDIAYFVSDGGGNWRCTGYQRASGTAVAKTNPGGSGTEVQYRLNATTFGAMAGTTWNNTNRTLTIAGATVTASNPILALSQTYNGGAGVTHHGPTYNVTDTASAAASTLGRWQVGGVDRVSFRKDGTIIASALQTPTTADINIVASGASASDYAIRWTGSVFAFVNATNTSAFTVYAENFQTPSTGGLVCGGATLIRDGNSGASVLNTGASAYRNLTCARVFVTGSTLTADTALDRNAAGVLEVNNGTAGIFRDMRVRTLISSGGVVTLSSYTVATLPAAASSTHSIVAVTDGNASPTYRGALTGGGSTRGLVYSDGTNWIWH